MHTLTDVQTDRQTHREIHEHIDKGDGQRDREVDTRGEEVLHKKSSVSEMLEEKRGKTCGFCERRRVQGARKTSINQNTT